MQLQRLACGEHHAAAGGALATAWNFPEDLVAIIGNHHGTGPGVQTAEALSEPTNLLLDVVMAADLVATACGFGGGDRVPEQSDVLQTTDELEFSEEAITALQLRLPNDLDAMLAVIGESR